MRPRLRAHRRAQTAPRHPLDRYGPLVGGWFPCLFSDLASDTLGELRSGPCAPILGTIAEHERLVQRGGVRFGGMLGFGVRRLQ